MGIQLTQVSVKQTDRLDKIVYEVGLEDLEFTLRYVAATAIQEQIALGNKPTNLLVDNSGRKAIDKAQRRVQAFFIDREMLRKAVYEAWAKVTALTRVRTGAAVGSYELWYNNQRIGKTPAAVELVIDRFDPGKDFFRIVGPVIVYGRKIYWNPLGKPRFRLSTALKTKQAIFKVRRIRGIMDLVESSMRRKYRGIAISESWVTTPALPKDGRTPALFIGLRRRGALRA